MSEPICLGDLPVGTAVYDLGCIAILTQAGPDPRLAHTRSLDERYASETRYATVAECAAWLAECEAARNDAQDRLYAAQQDYADTQTPVYNARRGLRAAIPSLDAFAIAQAVHADQRVKLAAVGAAQLAAIDADQALLLAEYALRLAREREAEHER